MNRVDAGVLWLLFGGGTILAAGSVLSSIKHSMTGAVTPSYPGGATISPPELLPEPVPKPDREPIPEKALAALPPPPGEPAETPELQQSHGVADTSRVGKNKKKLRKAESRKRARRKSSAEERGPSRRKNRN